MADRTSDAIEFFKGPCVFDKDKARSECVKMWVISAPVMSVPRERLHNRQG